MKPSAHSTGRKKDVTHIYYFIVLFIMFNTPGATVPQSGHLSPASRLHSHCLSSTSLRQAQPHHGGCPGLSLFQRASSGPPASSSSSHTIHQPLPEGRTSLGGSLTPQDVQACQGHQATCWAFPNAAVLLPHLLSATQPCPKGSNSFYLDPRFTRHPWKSCFRGS